MEKICVVCGKSFEAKTKRAKYCCKVCANHSRFNRTREEWHQDVLSTYDEVKKLYDLGLNDVQIAKQIGKSSVLVRNVRLKLNLKKQLTPIQKNVLELRNQGKCCVEIADLLKIDCKIVQQASKAIGMPFTEEEKLLSIEIGKAKAIKNHYGDIDGLQIKFIEEHHPSFIWVSGTHGGNDFMELKCRKCNSVIRKSAVTVRKAKTINCPVCAEIHKQEQIQERENERIKREQAKIERFWSQNFEQASFNMKECPECGLLFIGKYKYCSDDCKRKSLNRKMDQRIRKKYKSNTDITLKKLFNRDKGVCWLCGDKCDYEDYSRDEKGSFIAGKNYPSIDHVYPLSKGGVHSWNNVRLAHFYCNTIKSDKVVS